MTRILTGGCICKAVKYELLDDFQTFKLCHCDFCKKASGSSNVANAFGDPKNFKWTEGENHVKSFDVPESMVRRVFCSTCGTSLPFVSQNEQFLVVPVGSLDVQPGLPPQSVVFWDKRMPWYDDAAELK